MRTVRCSMANAGGSQKSNFCGLGMRNISVVNPANKCARIGQGVSVKTLPLRRLYGITTSIFFVLAVLFTAMVFAGCKSIEYVDRENPDLRLAAGEYDKAREIIKSRNAEYEKDKNHISYLLDTGLLNHFSGEYRASNEELEEAKRLIEEAYTKSLSERLRTIVTGKLKEQQYPGEDYENIYINLFNSLNYYHLGNYESAMVEIRQMNEKLKNMEGVYKAEADKLNAKNNQFKETPRELNFTNSALARYLGILYHRGNGNLDSARVDAQELANAFREFPNIYTFPVPPALALRDGVNEETGIPAGKARLNILSFIGLSDLKIPVNDNLKFWTDANNLYDSYEKEYWIHAHTEQIAPFKPLYVSLESRRSPVDRITVTVAGGNPVALSQIEDLEVVIKTLKDRLAQRMEQVEDLKIWADAVNYIAMNPIALFGNKKVRWYGYYVNQPLKTWAMDFQSEEYKEMLRNHVKGGLQAESREILDTRMGRFFPGKAYCGGVTVDPGTYTVTINYYAGNNLISTDRRENVQIQAGKLNLIQSVSFQGIKLPEFETSY